MDPFVKYVDTTLNLEQEATTDKPEDENEAKRSPCRSMYGYGIALMIGCLVGYALAKSPSR